MTRGFAAAVLAAALATAPPAGAEPAGPPDASRPPRSLEWLGVVEFPRGATFVGAPVGGLSSIGWDEAAEEFLALSDDRSEYAPARLYRLEIDLGDGKLEEGDVRVLGRIELIGRDGRPFGRRSLDPEGLALSADAMYVGSEGEATTGLDPFVAQFDRSGRWRRDLPLPARYLPDGHLGKGVRLNLGFESVALSPDGRSLFAATENALVQDGPEADAGVSSPARLLRWSLDRPSAPPEEYTYRVEGVRITPPNPTAFRVNGVVDLLPLSSTRLLALERQFVAGSGIEARIYLVDLDGATEISERDGLEEPTIVAASKELLFDFGDLGIYLDNLEGLVFGPPLADGRRSLIVVSDDNFGNEIQRTQVFAFAIDDRPVSIAGIQGAGHRSPLDGRWVFGVEGAVTAVVDRRDQRGFWMESESPDGDPATSEGIFVAWEGASTLAPGQRVSVNGRIAEEAANAALLPVTTLRLTALVEREGAATLAPPLRLPLDGRLASIDDDALARFEPASDALDLWESVEGMRVEIGPGTVIGPTREFGELVLLPDGAAAATRTSVGGVRLEPAGPPIERVVVSGRLVGGLAGADVGARLESGTVGVVDYSFTTYKVLAFARPSITPPTPVRCATTTRLGPARDRLSIASFNVENLSVAGPPERFGQLGRTIVEALAAPAVLLLEEIQDDSGPKDDGVTTARATLEALVAGIAAAGGPRYEPLGIDPENGREGGQPGGNIRVALLYDPLRVKVPRRGDAGALDGASILDGSAGPELSPNPGRVAPTSSAFALGEGEGVRRSLAVELQVAGEPLFLVGNHWSSKYEDQRDWGAAQPPAKPTAARRMAQATVVREWVEALLALDPEARVAVVGDLNDFEWSPAITHLAAPPLENLIGRIFEPERYTFNFEGASQVLDHVVVSPALAAGAEIEIVHVNADCAHDKRVSDHDPVVVRFRTR